MFKLCILIYKFACARARACEMNLESPSARNRNRKIALSGRACKKYCRFQRLHSKKYFFFIAPVLSNNHYNKTSCTKQKEKHRKLIEGLKNNCKIFYTKTSVSFLHGARLRRSRLGISRQNYMRKIYLNIELYSTSKGRE